MAVTALVQLAAGFSGIAANWLRDRKLRGEVRKDLLTGPIGLQTQAGDILAQIIREYEQNNGKAYCGDIDATIAAIEQVRDGFNGAMRQLANELGPHDANVVGVHGAAETITNVTRQLIADREFERAQLNCGSVGQTVLSYTGGSQGRKILLIGGVLILVALAFRLTGGR